MNLVKIRRQPNQNDTVQVTVTIPYPIAQHFTEANKMMMEYDHINGKLIGTPVVDVDEQ